jgi:RND family efflux transporter MFP subunit
MLNPRFLALSMLLAGISLSQALAEPEGSEPSGSDFFCQVNPSEKVELASLVPGVLDKILADRGAHVTEGQPVLTLRSDLEQAEVALAEAKVKAVGQLQGREAKLEFTTRKLNRNIDLAKSNVVSENDMDAMRTDRDMAAKDVQSATEAQNIAQMELRKAKVELDLHTIKSPITGVVTERHFSPGDLVREQPILVIQKTDPLYVEVALPVALKDKVKPGASARINFEVPGVQPVTAPVALADSEIEATSNMFGVRFVLPNKENAIPSGAKCHVSFTSTLTDLQQPKSLRGQ